MFTFVNFTHTSTYKYNDNRKSIYFAYFLMFSISNVLQTSFKNGKTYCLCTELLNMLTYLG